ncbi:MAG TPA: hypothetical protein VK177_07470 [Flavobacteriales bacterium]|nr:hypothetical protein [Flavobacteriales bacterium]
MKVQCAKPKAQIILVKPSAQGSWYNEDGSMSNLQPVRSRLKKGYNQIALPLF